MRKNNRELNQLRDVSIEINPMRHAEGSALIKMGDTHVLCSSSVELSVPKWMSGSGKGWVSSEYAMLPRSTHTRIRRDKGANSGRSQEISRLIGRSLRASIDMEVLGEKQVYIDCDVIQADGGTRTAAITGGYVSLYLACDFMIKQGQLKKNPMKNFVSAISVGLKDGQGYLDLDYDEDSCIDTDMNFVMNDTGEFIELQGTAEKGSFSVDHLNQMIALAQSGCNELISKQKEALKNCL